MNQILGDSGIEEGTPIRLTVGTRAAQEGGTYSGSVSFTDENGVSVSRSFAQDSAEITLYGVPQGGEIAISSETGDVIIASVRAEAIEREGADGQELLAQMDPATTLQIPEALLGEAEAEEGQEAGVKIYVDSADGLSGVVVLNGDWNTHQDISAEMIQSDGEGTYIWCAYAGAAEVNQVEITCYWADQTVGIRRIVRLAAAEEPGEIPSDDYLAEITTIGETVDLSEYLADAERETGEASGVKVYIDTEGSWYSGNVLFDASWSYAPEISMSDAQEDENGTYIWLPYEDAASLDYVGIVLWGMDANVRITGITIVEGTEEEVPEDPSDTFQMDITVDDPVS